MIYANDLVRPLIFALVLTLSCHSVSAQTSSYKLTHFDCNIRIADPHHVAVTVLIRIASDGGHFPLSLTLVHYSTQAIDDLRIVDHQGGPISTVRNLTSGALVVSIPWPEGPAVANSGFAFRVGYEVVDASSDISRIPLPVPNARTAFGERPVQIAIALPPEGIATGDTFPTLNWQDQSRGEAALANVPSLAMIRWRPIGSVRLADRIFTSSVLTDAGMLAILFAGSLVWWLRSRGGVRNRVSAD
jgi:hypothetical protein